MPIGPAPSWLKNTADRYNKFREQDIGPGAVNFYKKLDLWLVESAGHRAYTKRMGHGPTFMQGTRMQSFFNFTEYYRFHEYYYSRTLGESVSLFIQTAINRENRRLKEDAEPRPIFVVDPHILLKPKWMHASYFQDLKQEEERQRQLQQEQERQRQLQLEQQERQLQQQRQSQENAAAAEYKSEKERLIQVIRNIKSKMPKSQTNAAPNSPALEAATIAYQTFLDKHKKPAGGRQTRARKTKNRRTKRAGRN